MKSHLLTGVGPILVFGLCDMLLNNIFESFNGAILHASDKPIITVLKGIKVYLMNRITRKRESVNNLIGQL